MKRGLTVLAVAAAMVASVLGTAGAQTEATGANALYYFSEPGDYVGQGQEVTLTDADIDFSASLFGDGTIRFVMNSFSRPGQPSIWWFAYFAPPDGGTLDVGVYDGATRWPFQASTDPGLSFFGQGRGCNRLTGSFEVLEAVYSSSGIVEQFAVDFEQHCEGREPALFGSIRYNSNVPLPVLLPPKVEALQGLNSDGCVEATDSLGADVTFLATSPNSIPVDYSWTTSNGHSGTGSTIGFPVTLNADVDLIVTISDPVSGDSASAAVSVCVSDTTAPTVIILSPQAGEEFTGENARLEVAVSDAVDDSILEYELQIIERTALVLGEDGTGTFPLFGKSKDGPIALDVTVEATDSSGNTGFATVTIYRIHNNSG